MEPLLAHGEPWTVAPLEIAALTFAAGLYAARARTLAVRGRRLERRRPFFFVGGLAVALVAVATPLGHLADELFAAHMVQHLLLGDLAALLVVAGLTGPLLRPILVVPALRHVRVLAHPLLALPLWVANLYFWHLPGAYQAALASASIHAVEHALFFATGALMWAALLEPLPGPRWFGGAAKVVYVLAVRAGMLVLGNVFLLSSELFYPAYARGERVLGLSPLEDQQVAGALLLLEGGAVTFVLLAWAFLRFARESEERQRLLEGGVRPERASRAARYGRASSLLVLLLPLLTLSCGGDQSTLAPASDAAETIEQVWWILFAVSAVVVAVVVFLVLLAVVRPGGRPLTVPGVRDPLLGRALVLVGGAAIPAVVLVALFALTVRTLPAVSATGAEAELTVEVEGHQWFWEVRYPEREIVTANEIHIPARTAVRIEVTTDDVIHSFWVPRLNRKIDLIPGQVNSIVLEARRPGTYRGQCAEFCGVQHANMAFLVIAHEPAEFEAWAAREAEPAAEPAGETLARGRDVFFDSGCAGCHAIQGTGADGDVGPDLTHLASRTTLAAVTIPNRRGWLGGWVLDPQHVKPGNRMPATNIPGEDFQALLDYLESLE